jgi:hypothetical protein
MLKGTDSSPLPVAKGENYVHAQVFMKTGAVGAVGAVGAPVELRPTQKQQHW